MKFQTLSESIDGRGPKIAIYGESGTGKTTQLAAIWQLVPDDKKFLIITAEHGLRSLRHACPEMLDAENIVVAECHSVSEVKEAVAFAQDPANAVAWCAVDSVSNVAERELRARLETAGDPRQAYGAVQVGTLGILWQLVDCAGLGVLFIFQESRKEVNEGTAKRPEMVNHYSMTVPSDALKQSVPYTFDAVLRLELKADGTRQIRTSKTSTIMAKDRTGKLNPMEAADLGAIVEKILA
jgi:ABC-type dipeptide/oligopeptide/nickel transport system ATPase component